MKTTLQNVANLYTFLLFICNNLILSLDNKKYTIIMDNCKIHKNVIIKNILEYCGHTMIFLPAYCPHLNPIEYHFQILKKRIKKYSQYSPQLLEILIDELEKLRNINMISIIREAGYLEY